jgi:hypothetical protein
MAALVWVLHFLVMLEAKIMITGQRFQHIDLFSPDFIKSDLFFGDESNILF